MVLDPDRSKHPALASIGDPSGSRRWKDDVHGLPSGAPSAVPVWPTARVSSQTRRRPSGSQSTANHRNPRRLGYARPFHDPRQAENPIGQAVDAGGRNGFHDLM